MSRTAKPECDQWAAKSPPFMHQRPKVQTIFQYKTFCLQYWFQDFWIANPGDRRQLRRDPAWANYFNSTLKAEQLLGAPQHPTLQQLPWADREQTLLSTKQQNSLNISELLPKFLTHILLQQWELPTQPSRTPRKRKLMPLEWQQMYSSWFTPRAQLTGKLLSVKSVYYNHLSDY